ncbi:GvpL/GvpF family gas vesicle protein [Floridanema aerugineum]|jgi:hypothetical protein|uniref:GvpL/GvpF family gas vesicle protein n=1 Tax=Floridaenema aerugineum BLCC-F46 TaxID=3153654 RepID=A0ABV4WXW2_9CYAN
MESSNLYTYCFLNTPNAAIELPIGINQPGFLVSSAGVAALVEAEVDLESIKEDDQKLIQAVVEHDHVICQIFSHTTVLPLRFGTSFASQESLLNHLESHAQEYLEKLQQLKGKGEYILKFTSRTLEDEPISNEAGGRQYFLAKKQRYQAQQNFYTAQAAEWENMVSQITEIHKSAVVVEPQNDQAKIYLLVSRQEESLLAEQFLSWQKACHRWELSLGEALPPYHFI